MHRLLLLFIIFSACVSKSEKKNDRIDPDIVIINIEEGDRSFIGRTLLTIDSCKPKLIGIDAWFIQEKDSVQDIALINALKNVKNVILGYSLDTLGHPLRSHFKFRTLVDDEGLAVLQIQDGLSSHFTPITLIDNKENEHIALKIVRKWQPDFTVDIDKGKTIPINFSRTLDQFIHLNASELKAKKNFNDINNKIVLLGYIGPSNEDKHFTPFTKKLNTKNNEPDTYGVVIIANEIRTILDYKK
jgi:CHASE2 domain-containing sensor protein